MMFDEKVVVCMMLSDPLSQAGFGSWVDHLAELAELGSFLTADDIAEQRGLKGMVVTNV
jgi:hypothetical protein